MSHVSDSVGRNGHCLARECLHLPSNRAQCRGRLSSRRDTSAATANETNNARVRYRNAGPYQLHGAPGELHQICVAVSAQSSTARGLNPASRVQICEGALTPIPLHVAASVVNPDNSSDFS
jgi:hypothetical protein